MSDSLSDVLNHLNPAVKATQDFKPGDKIDEVNRSAQYIATDVTEFTDKQKEDITKAAIDAGGGTDNVHGVKFIKGKDGKVVIELETDDIFTSVDPAQFAKELEKNKGDFKDVKTDAKHKEQTSAKEQASAIGEVLKGFKIDMDTNPSKPTHPITPTGSTSGPAGRGA